FGSQAGADLQMPQKSVNPLWGSLALDRNSDVSLREQIVSYFRAAVADGRLPAGRRVASSRQFAGDFDISRTTAVEAYERLIEEGYLLTRPGAGVFVSETPPERFKLNASGRETQPAEPADFMPVDMRQYHLPLAPGMPALDRFPLTIWARLTNQLCREQPLNVIGYGDPLGELALREAIVEYLGAARGIVCRPEQIVVISGSAQTLAFILQHVATAGANAWFEDPSSPYVRAVLRRERLQAVAVPVDALGMDVEAGMRRAPRARLAIVSPSHQDPTGASMAMERRQALVEWAESVDGWIVENEIDGDYRYTSRPLAPIYTLSPNARVIYCGSLSKPLAPGLRANYLVLPRRLMAGLTLRQTLVPRLTQLVLARFSSQGFLASHMNKMRTLYARRRVVLLQALREHAAQFLDVANIPEAGLRVTAALRVGLDDVRVSARCLAAGIKVDPLSTCYVNAEPKAGLIMGFASTPEERIGPAVRILVAALRGELDL
ncbi:MAG: PLP-dependent aminotransferase family protein, partial [Pseudomonadota bacterium]